jgi:hypothetical protein
MRIIVSPKRMVYGIVLDPTLRAAAPPQHVSPGPPSAPTETHPRRSFSKTLSQGRDPQIDTNDDILCGGPDSERSVQRTSALPHQILEGGNPLGHK